MMVNLIKKSRSILIVSLKSSCKAISDNQEEIRRQAEIKVCKKKMVNRAIDSVEKER